MKKPDFVTIRRESTLEELSQFFKVDKDYLRRYHNIHCAMDDLIETDIPKHLIKLFVPPKDKNYQMHLMSGFADAAFSPADVLMKNKLFRKEYGIIQTLYENGTKKTRISCLTEVEKTGKYTYRIIRKNIYVNHNAPDLVAEKLAERAGSIFFPLELETSENSNLKQITNMTEIKKRWKNLKTELAKYYVGKTAEKIIDRIDNELECKDTIQNRILGSLFYRLYFLPFRDYADAPEKKSDLYLPLFPFKNKVKYKVKTLVQPKFSETGKLLLEINGNCADVRTFSEIMNGKRQQDTEGDKTDKCVGSMQALYKFSKEDGSLCSAEAEITLESDDGKNSRKITFEMYQQ